MRKITFVPIAQFSSVVAVEAAVALAATKYLVMPWFDADFRGLAAVVGAITLFYILAIAVFRLIQAVAPVPAGDIEQGSIGERHAFLYLLHYLLLFNPLIFSRTMPVPLMRLVLQSLGAKMGENSYCAGIMMDPQFVIMGRDSIIGNSAMIIPHALEGDRFGFHHVRIGNRVTIGARAIIMTDVDIGDDATVAIQSVVVKGTRIAAGETWGGTPARRLRAVTDNKLES
jgi:acetyltransferase-like isoleucine patch superfamily enzyme